MANLTITKIADGYFNFTDDADNVYGGNNIEYFYDATNIYFKVNNQVYTYTFEEVSYDDGNETIGFASTIELIATLKSAGFTGNFNAGGATPQFIPLSGTTENNFVTGDVEFGIANDGGYGKIGVRNDTISLITTEKEVNVNGFRDNTFNGAFINELGQFRVEKGTNAESLGIYSVSDFSEISLENKLIYAQRSYVENPQTLINTLNNANETQLNEIKTILGII